MDLRKALEKGHSKHKSTQISDYVGNNRALFKQLVEVFLAGPYRITQRAAWPLSICAARNPALLRPHLSRILSFLQRADIHAAVKRNVMRLLQFVEIPRSKHGEVIDLCYRYLQDRKEPVAVKVFSMSVMHKLTSDQPDIGRELRMIIEDQLPYGSPAFVSRARKVIKEISDSTGT